MGDSGHTEPWSPKAGRGVRIPSVAGVGFEYETPWGLAAAQVQGEAKTWPRKTYLFKEMEQGETWEEGQRKEGSSSWP